MWLNGASLLTPPGRDPLLRGCRRPSVVRQADGIGEDRTVDTIVSTRAARGRKPGIDQVCAEAVDLARAAAVEDAGNPARVGDHLGADAEGERLVLHRFSCRMRGYIGWHWAVVVTRASRSKAVTVNDVVLLPGDEAVLPPAWVPWSERLRPGDLGVGDLLPTAVDDPRLALRGGDVEELSDNGVFTELGLGRPRVLSAEGRDDAAERWYEGDNGPEAAIARAAPAACVTCGFHVRLVGALGQVFGVCANTFAPDDGRVTSMDHGCGAHSEALVLPSAHPEPVRYDDDELEDLESVPLPGRPVQHAEGSVSDAEPAEPYGHG
jgi:hypothetical protein